MKSLFFGQSAARKALEPRDMTWPQFVQLLRNPAVVDVAQTKFLALASGEKFLLKDGRYVCPTRFSPPTRNNLNTTTVELICIDVDDPAHAALVTPERLGILLDGLNWALYSTISSTPDAPRYRIMVDADGQIDSAHYPRCVATIAARLGLPGVTTESLTLSQPMFLPKICRDGSYIFSEASDGAPFQFEDIADVGIAAAVKGDPDAGDFESGWRYLTPPADVDAAQIAEALEYIDADIPQQEWAQIGMALKHQFQADEETGFELFNEWSERGEKYGGETATRKLWSYLKPNPLDRKPVTIRTLFHLARKSGYTETIDPEDVDAIIEQIAAANDRATLLTTIPGAISELRIDETLREMLVARLKQRSGDVLGSPLPLQVLRRACARRHSATDIYETTEGALALDQPLPAWARGIYYVQATDEFYRAADGLRRNPRVMDRAYARYLMTEDDIRAGRSKPAVYPSDFLLNVCSVPTAVSYVYLPGQPAEVAHAGGGVDINTWRDLAPAPDDTHVDDVRETIESHARWLLADEEAEILLDFLAYTVQQQCDRVNWAILLQGVPGCGKTYFHQLMGACLGAENCRELNNDTVTGQHFTGWAENSKFSTFEEIHISGQNRFALMDKMKPYITNTRVVIRRLHTPEYSIPNVTNYLMLSNHKDAIAINEHDRRYCVLMSKIQYRQQLPGPAYFEHIFRLIDRPEMHGSILQYFLTRKISAAFNPRGNAPLTRHREIAIELSRSDAESAILDLLDGYSPLLTREILSSTALSAVLAAGVDGKRLDIGNRALSRALHGMGFSNVGRTRIGGQKHTIWLHGLTNGEIRRDPLGWIKKQAENSENSIDESCN